MGMVRCDKVGSMIIEFDVEFPKILSDDQKKTKKYFVNICAII